MPLPQIATDLAEAHSLRQAIICFICAYLHL